MGCSWAPLGRSGALLGRSWASCFFSEFSKMIKKHKICHLRGSWTALGSPPDDQTSIFDPPRVVFYPPGDDLKAFPSSLHRQTRAKSRQKSWRSPGENHNQHSVQPKRMNSKRWCGGLASASSIRRPISERCRSTRHISLDVR